MFIGDSNEDEEFHENEGIYPNMLDATDLNRTIFLSTEPLKLGKMQTWNKNICAHYSLKFKLNKLYTDASELYVGNTFSSS